MGKLQAAREAAREASKGPKLQLDLRKDVMRVICTDLRSFALVLTPSAKTGKGKQKQDAAKKSKGQTPKGPKKPTYSDEKTRSQFLFRTGLTGPGQSTAIKYTAATKARAEAKAVEMVAKEKKKRRLL